MPKRVLIVDADEFSCRALERMLVMYEYDIDAVDDAETALTVLPYALPDLVIVSPPLDRDFIDQVKRTVPRASVLALLPLRVRDEDRRIARREGYVDLLTKPVDPLALSRAFRVAIGPPEPWPGLAEH